jgi:hypothetical protein
MPRMRAVPKASRLLAETVLGALVVNIIVLLRFLDGNFTSSKAQGTLRGES